jgi:nitroreductase
MKTLSGLRTVHGGFSDRSITGDDLRAILQASVRAANASGRQSYSLIVLDDAATMRSVCGYSGSKAIVFCVDFSRIATVALHMGYQDQFVDLVEFITASVDVSLAVQTAVIAAKSLGIDSLITNGVHRAKMEDVYPLLGLPEKYCFPLITLVLGYPEKEPENLKGRLSGAGIVHYGKYAPLSERDIGELIAAYDDDSLRLGINPDWRKQGFAHYLDWFYSKWNGLTDTVQVRDIAGHLERSGFLEGCN